MFDLGSRRPIDLDFPVIVSEYEVLHFDEMPILFTGVNRYDSRIIGSSVEEDFDRKIARYFHVVISADDYTAFRRGRVSYRDLIDRSPAVFVIDESFDGTERTVCVIRPSEIPDEYRP
jgi:hypothetical protein